MARDSRLADEECYVERRSALRWPLVAWGLGAPVALIAAFTGLAIFVNPQWFVAVAFTPCFAPILIGISLLYRNWPTGVRIDAAGVSIGAVGSKRAATRRLTVTHQNRGLFSCAWPQVRYVEVVTSPARIREISTSPQYWTLSNHWGKPREITRCMAGVLTAPFMKAALVIRVGTDEAGVVSPELRPARLFSNYISSPRFSTRLAVDPSLEWVVPTRHPDELRAFLAATGRTRWLGIRGSP